MILQFEKKKTVQCGECNNGNTYKVQRLYRAESKFLYWGREGWLSLGGNIFFGFLNCMGIQPGKKGIDEGYCWSKKE